MSSPPACAIALIGLACRFPAAASAGQFWQNLLDGHDAISEVPPGRWSLADFYAAEPDQPGRMRTRYGGFVSEIERFDAGFFGIAPREAEQMSPQQRLTLEVAWEALEDACVAPVGLAGTAVGVFLGVASFDYYERLLLQTPERIDGYALTGNAYSIAANRLSYLLDLRGPSMAIDTACSSSLVAVHLACQSLLNGETELALAGGTHAMLSPWVTIAASRGEFMAPDGRCKTFDARADGYVRGEGCGVVVLKRYADALRDGDPIRAVLLGGAVNQDGRSNGLTAPNPAAQVAVLRQAYEQAGIDPATVGYIEAHGTGTRLGDPMELNSLGTVLGTGRAAETPCLVGSVKTNIGHLEAAAGVAGLIKATLTIQAGEIPPSLHFGTPNPLIDFARLPLRVAATRQHWPTDGPRLAGVSAFGFGGTNAHIVLGQAPEPEAAPAPRPQQLFCLSARSETALRQLAVRYLDALEDMDAAAFAATCQSLGRGRNHFEHRLALVAPDAASCRDCLRRHLDGEEQTGLSQGRARQRRAPRLAFLFTGQGAQQLGMARELYRDQPVFRATLDRCDALLRPLLGNALLDLIYGEQATASRLAATEHAQPALFSLQVALLELLKSWGVRPTVVLGHSVGEFAAAYAAGVLSLEDGLALTTARGRLMQALPEAGGMLAVTAAAERLDGYLADFDPAEIRLAAFNSETNTVVAGRSAALSRLAEQLSRDGIVHRPLDVSHAFHSPLMAPMLEPFRAELDRLHFAAPGISFISTVDAAPLDGQLDWPDYWCRQVSQPVRFAAALRRLEPERYDALIEIGPRAVLSGLARQIVPDGPPVLPLLRGDGKDWRASLSALGRLYVLGLTPDWTGLDAGVAMRRRAGLPHYPFERQHFWALPAPLSRRAAEPLHPLLAGAERESDGPDCHRFRLELSNTRTPYLADHRVFGADVLPATAYIEIAQAGVAALQPLRRWQLEQLEFRRPFFLSAAPRRLELTLRADAGAWRFAFADPADSGRSERRTYASGLVRPDLTEEMPS
ncbi:type I polyketide synthase [Chitinimonas lacunae]|uniref:Type I polyketide synthase n=1 Tax=Chitinimonas lacunae TaxID=1963018 RepID=A0ABV8MTQ3_9NEIS